jgi:hypothetical protein
MSREEGDKGGELGWLNLDGVEVVCGETTVE